MYTKEIIKCHFEIISNLLRKNNNSYILIRGVNKIFLGQSKLAILMKWEQARFECWVKNSIIVSIQIVMHKNWGC
jgi:hypothetical protein